MAVRRREYLGPMGKPAWSFDFCHRGFRHRKAGFETKAEALIAEADARKLARESAPRRKSGLTLFSASVKAFLDFRCNTHAHTTLVSETARGEKLQAILGDKPLSRFTVGEIQQFVTHRKQDGVSNRTVNLDLTFLRSLFRYAVDNGIVGFNPAAKVKNLKVPKRDREVISREEFAALIAACEKTRTGKGLALWVAISGMTGMRPTESLTLQWRDVMLDDNRIMVRPKIESPVKTGQFRAVPIAEELKPRLVAWREEWERRTAGLGVDHDWVFIHWHDPRRRTLCFRTAFQKAVEKAGIAHMTRYDLRHFFITECVKQHLSLLTISRWVGHSSLTMINEVYAHLDDGFHQEEMRRACFTATSPIPSGASPSVEG